MSGLFISYRREDSAKYAGRLREDLRRLCSQDQIFMDSDIAPGTDFRKVIAEKLNHSNVLLVLIGPRWLDAKDPKSGDRRLEQESDFVRIEIATALENKIKVIPVILPGGSIPPHDQLPKLIRDPAWRQAIQLRNSRWAHDVNKLVNHLPRNVTSWKLWISILIATIAVFLTAMHLFALLTDVGANDLLPMISFFFGLIHTVFFKFSVRQKILVGLAIAVAYPVFVSLVVPVLVGQDVIPRSLAEVRLFGEFVALTFFSYLAGTMLAEILLRLRRIAVRVLMSR